MLLLNPVFIHGWAFSSKIFGNLPGIKIDLPGHGKNEDRYESLLKTAQSIALSLPGKHDIIGWSLGGSLALLIASLFPSKVRRLFLIGTSPYFWGAWEEKNLRAFKLRIKREGVEVFRSMAYPRRFEDRLYLPDALRMLEDYMRMDLRDRASLLGKETFILQGEKDRIVPPLEAFKLHSLIKGSKLITLPGGHFPAEDERSLLSTLLKVSSDVR